MRLHGISARGLLALAAGLLIAVASDSALADPNLPRVRFIACAAGNPLAQQVPANTPLYVLSGWVSGTKGLVATAVASFDNRFDVTYSAGGTATFHPLYGPVFEQEDGSWRASLSVELGSLDVGESMTIHWTYVASRPVQDLIPPSAEWDPILNGQPAWDGTGLKYQVKVEPGSHDNGTCTVTAVAP